MDEFSTSRNSEPELTFRRKTAAPQESVLEDSSLGALLPRQRAERVQRRVPEVCCRVTEIRPDNALFGQSGALSSPITIVCHVVYIL